MTPLERLKQEYEDYLSYNYNERAFAYGEYAAVKQFCLGCSLLSLEEIEEMENSCL